jgi:hypothetical protein
VANNQQGKLRSLINEARFFHYIKKELSGCWKWTGPVRGPLGKEYGRTRFYGKTTSAHRVSWIIHRGEIPNDKIILHLCNNPLCVNPEHLKIGTYAENTHQSLRERRWANQYMNNLGNKGTNI